MPLLSMHRRRHWARRRSKGDKNMGMMQEFEEFAVKGNVIDLAVGIVIGTAFGKIVNSLVNDVIMPPIGILISDVDFKSLALTLRHGPDAKSTVTLNYGNFIQTVVEFLIIAWCVFLMVKALNQIRRMGEKHLPVPDKRPTEGPPK
jgi:large conductance mechanosensitive channel